MTWVLVITFFLIFLILEGFFSGSEMAMVSCDKIRLRHAATLGSRWALMAQRFVSEPEFLFSTTIVGTNLSVVANTFLITFFIHQRWGAEYEFLTLLLSPVILVFGELIPKSLFQNRADLWITRISLPLRFFSYLLYPFVVFFSRLTRLLLGKVVEEGRGGGSLSREELKDLLNMGEAKMLIWERRLLFRLFNFTEIRVEKVMTPLSQAYAIKSDATVAEVMAELSEEGYSRVPLYDKRVHNVIGILETSELLFYSDKNFPVSQMMRPPFYVPSSMPAGELLQIFQKEGKNIAIVVDEFGATIGLVTLEDLVEEIVGEIEDEYDEETPLIQRIGPKQHLLSGQVRLKEIEETLHITLPPGNYETLNGFLLASFHRIPQQGEILHHGELNFMIKRSTARSILEVILEEG
ncbi:MAG: HlyC/CorC family transporter [Deltaproteobacteria bacterium]|nr:HlyC/CorC family transporter [Deltaproteobacteria bacterium]